LLWLQKLWITAFDVLLLLHLRFVCHWPKSAVVISDHGGQKKEKSLLISYHQLSFFRRPAVITSVWIVCLSSSRWIEGFTGRSFDLSLSLSPHRDMTNQCSQTLQLFACPNNFFSPPPPYSTPFPLFKAPTTFGRVGRKFGYAMSFGPQLHTPPQECGYQFRERFQILGLGSI
jgi:hypothetical protein